MEGSKFLKVTGILMIIGGAISIIVGIIGLLAVGAAALLGANSGLLTVSTILCLVAGVLELIAGIVGVKNCNNPAAAKKCMGWGIVVAAMSVVSNILTVVAGGSFSVVGLITGLIVPVLYIIGAAKNSKQAA